MEYSTMASILLTVCSACTVVLLGYILSIIVVQSTQVASEGSKRAAWSRVSPVLVLLSAVALITFTPLTPVVTYTSPALQKGVARLPVTINFSAYQYYPGATDSFFSFLTVKAVNALNNGFFGSPVPFDVDCPSGDCSWSKPYTTLALCSSCTDLTSSLSAYKDADGNEVGVKLPNGFSLQYNAGWNLPLGERQPYTSFNATGLHSTEFAARLFHDYESIAYKDYAGKLHGVFAIVGSNPGSSQYMSESPEPAAWECAIQWCLQQSTAKYADGKLNEKVLKTINTTIVENKNDFNFSRTLTDPDTKQQYNVSSLSDGIFSGDLARFVNGSREANITGDASPLTVLYSAVARGDKNPTALYENIAATLNSFMRQPNSELVFGNWSYAEGIVNKATKKTVSLSWTFMVYPALVMVFATIFAHLAGRKARPAVALTSVTAIYTDDEKL